MPFLSHPNRRTFSAATSVAIARSFALVLLVLLCLTPSAVFAEAAETVSPEPADTVLAHGPIAAIEAIPDQESTSPEPTLEDMLRPLIGSFVGLDFDTEPMSYSCATDGICNFQCGIPYDWDCAIFACNEPNVCGSTGGTCPFGEQCWLEICVCM